MVWWGFRWGAGLFICWDGKSLLSKSKATPKHMISTDLKQVTGRRGHGRVHTNLASSTIQTYTYTYRILIYDKYMIIVQKMTTILQTNARYKQLIDESRQPNYQVTWSPYGRCKPSNLNFEDDGHAKSTEPWCRDSHFMNSSRRFILSVETL